MKIGVRVLAHFDFSKLLVKTTSATSQTQDTKVCFSTLNEDVLFVWRGKVLFTSNSVILDMGNSQSRLCTNVDSLGDDDENITSYCSAKCFRRGKKKNFFKAIVVRSPQFPERQIEEVEEMQKSSSIDLFELCFARRRYSTKSKRD